MVRGSNSSGFLCMKRSMSLSGLLIGDSVGELHGVGAPTGSFPFFDTNRGYGDGRAGEDDEGLIRMV